MISSVRLVFARLILPMKLASENLDVSPRHGFSLNTFLSAMLA